MRKYGSYKKAGMRFARQEARRACPTKRSNYSLPNQEDDKPETSFSIAFVTIVLFLILIVFLFQLKSAKSIAHEVKNNVEKIEEEFEDYKHKALEKEQKLGRQLQDEINKHKSSK